MFASCNTSDCGEDLKQEGVTVDDLMEEVVARLKEPALGKAALGPYVTEAKPGNLHETSFVLQEKKHYAGQNEDDDSLASKAKKLVHAAMTTVSRGSLFLVICGCRERCPQCQF